MLFLKTLPLLKIVCYICLILLIALGVQSCRLNSSQDKYDKLNSDIALERAQWELEAERLRTEYLATLNSIRGRYEKQTADIESKHSELVSSLDRRLRQRFSCPPVLSQAPAPTGSVDGTQGGGFTSEDGRIAFGIARDGDRGLTDLRACQEYVRSITE